MAVELASFLNKVEQSYERYYNVVTGDAGSGLPLFMFADFHARDEGYVLVKSAKIWKMESNEYVYVFSAERLDLETVKKCLDYALADGLPRVTPHKEHRDSYIIAAFVADVIDPEAKNEIRRRKFDKSFKLGLEGWVALRTAAVELEGECVTTNRLGSDMGKYFKKLLRSEKL